MSSHRPFAQLGFLSQIIRHVNPLPLIAIIVLATPAAGIFSQNPRAGMGPIALTVLDAERDGRADVAVANSLDDNVSLLVGIGGGGFAPPRNFHIGVAPLSVVSCDTDGDGRMDLIVGNSDGSISLLRANGPAQFGDALTVAVDVALV